MDPMIAALLQPGAYDHPVGCIELIETHISWVLLTGSYAYKVKKPVDLGFVDFSTPERRRWFCQEELRLNRRLAAELYIGLCDIHGPPVRASFRATGPPIEVAVKMHQFPQVDLLPAVLARGELTPAQLDQLADSLVSFHRVAAVAEAGQPYGASEAVRAPAFANLDVLQVGADDAERLLRLRRWSEAEAERLEPVFAARQEAGSIRECHGDLHLGNMVRHRGRIEVFDCLEFSPALRWIDPISDMAFLVMDLEQRGRPDAGHRVLNRWLEGNGDYAGLPAWRWYLVYRALVRAKVTTLRLRQGARSAAEQTALQLERAGYLAWAEATTHASAAALVITHGVSGSGKTHLARRLCEQLGWIQLRSDVERRRLFGHWGPVPPAVTLSGDPYREEVSEWLYGERLVACAEAILSAGLSLIVDATFLRRRHRQVMADLANHLGVGFAILDCRCSPELARRRIRERRLLGLDPSEADEAVLETQLVHQDPLDAWERTVTIAVEDCGDRTGEEERIQAVAATLSALVAD